jgi:beta-galactosidase
VVTPELAARLESYVESGGTLLLGPRSGVKDANATVVGELLPGLLRRLAGATVEDYDVFSALGPGRIVRLRDADGRESTAYGLAEVLAPEAGQAFLWYADDYYAGRAAAVENGLGKGRCVYIGTVLGDQGLARLFSSFLPGHGGRSSLPPGLELVRRVAPGAPGRRYAFYLNHTPGEMRVRAELPGRELLSGNRVEGEILLPAYGVAVVAE